MAAISAAQVKELRLKTDAPMMECKKALTEADGDMALQQQTICGLMQGKLSGSAVS